MDHVQLLKRVGKDDPCSPYSPSPSGPHPPAFGALLRQQGGHARVRQRGIQAAGHHHLVEEGQVHGEGHGGRGELANAIIYYYVINIKTLFLYAKRNSLFFPIGETIGITWCR